MDKEKAMQRDTLVQVRIAVEHPRGSGRLCDATEVAVIDANDQELWRGSAADYIGGKVPKFDGPTKLVATKLGQVRQNAYSKVRAAYYSES